MTKTSMAAEMRLWRATLRALEVVYVMFFGEGDRWSVWAVVMAGLVGLFLWAATDGFIAAPSLGQIVFMAVFVAISAVGVYIRRKRKDDQ
ncbi:hypothetical protein [Pseudorhodobacter wandonensis]|uniref:hypothetical protein n=1 Tax=Pseudorhodobacter wandonensis TaxID=1120568 RepID=UPI0012E1701B|nr:hypothetical protein [Pseudorhodobacter wandonensis]